MGRERLDRIVEALILVAREPVSASRIASLVGDVDGSVVSDAEVEERIQRFVESCAGTGFEAVKSEQGWVVRSATSCMALVERFLLFDPNAVRLTDQVMETLGVIAYRQPITRSQIERIRGHNPSATIATLVEQNYIEQAGRDRTPAQAILYATTDHFLEAFGLRSLDELPPLDAAEVEMSAP